MTAEANQTAVSEPTGEDRDTGQDPTGPDSASPDSNEAAVAEEAGSQWEAELDVYPLRAPEADPGWAVMTVKIWLGFALFSLVAIVLLVILGFFYE